MRRAVFLSAIVLAGLARGVAAQQAPGRPAQRLIDSVTTLVTVTAAPRTIQVFVVPVPVSFRPDRPVDYTVVPTGGATIIPPLHGIVAAGGGEARSVMVAASIPAGALAGATHRCRCGVLPGRHDRSGGARDSGLAHPQRQRPACAAALRRAAARAGHDPVPRDQHGQRARHLRRLRGRAVAVDALGSSHERRTGGGRDDRRRGDA